MIRNGVWVVVLAGLQALPAYGDSVCPSGVLAGAAVLASGWRQDAPGLCRRLVPADLPKPGGATTAPPLSIDRADGMLPKAPPGFTVTLAYRDQDAPRLLRTAPNGDLFVSESEAGVVRVLRPDGKGGFAEDRVFAKGLDYPFGVAFYPAGPEPTEVYIAETNRVVRYPYHSGDLVASGPAETIVATLPHGGNHISRDVVFPDADHMLVSVGSASNDANDGERETLRADILRARPDGGGVTVFASGLRNPVALAIEPASGALWTTVNERDQLGDNLVPDYVTHVDAGRFYGWPWYYIGTHVDPRHFGDAPRVGAIAVPDLLLVSHSAPLGMVFSAGTRFPAAYRRGAFVALHGSWNRGNRNAGKVVFVPAKADGMPANYYSDFLTGFTIGGQNTADGTGAWGRPVGVAMGADGALYVSDDEGRAIWRVDHAPAAP